jgi:hypothetical protein
MPNFAVLDVDRTIYVSDDQYAGLRKRLEGRSTAGDEAASAVLEKLPAGPFDHADWRAIFDAIDAWAAETDTDEAVGPELMDVRSDIATHLNLGTNTGESH